MAFFLTIGHSRLVSVPGSLHLPWRLIIRRFELSDKTYSRTNFEPATRVAVRRASGLVLVGYSEAIAQPSTECPIPCEVVTRRLLANHCRYTNNCSATRLPNGS